MRKDTKLNNMVKDGVNVAQFISVDKEDFNKVKYINIKDYVKQEKDELKDIIKTLIRNSGSKSVNIRSFSDTVTKGNKLVMNKTIGNIDEILDIIKTNAEEGRHSIVNENIDVSDGGVSGVIMGDVIEFSPDNTSRCVERNGVCSLPVDIGMNILKIVYGFSPDIPFSSDYRVEFSIHPLKQGVYGTHTIIWEYEKIDERYKNIKTKINFPNNFSRFLGDKVFGLLIADSLGINVPYSTVICRNVAPFSFGKDTGSYEKWIRTAPINKEAGLYFTGKGWVDPFEMIQREEGFWSTSIKIASVICQQSVNSLYSGAGIVRELPENDVIEGVPGNGDKFMVGISNNQCDLPFEVIEEVKNEFNVLRNFRELLGDFTVEWVYDGNKIWIVQLNQLKEGSLKRNVIVDGDKVEYIDFYAKEGLNKLRDFIKNIDNKKQGIKIIGEVGVTSHFGDLLRLYGIPSYIVRE